MRIWVVRDAEGLFASPSFWLLTGENEAVAIAALNEALVREGLDPSKGFTLEEIDGTKAAVHMLTAGEC